MPKALEDLRKKIAKNLSGKTNPKTKKPYTTSEIYAIAQAQYKKTKPQMKGYLFSEGIELKSDGKKWYLEGSVAAGGRDLVNDVVEETALHQLVSEWNTNPKALGYWHTEIAGGKPELVPIGTSVAGTWKLQEGKAQGKFLLNDNISIWNEVKGSIEDGHLNALSIEYNPTDFETVMSADGIEERHIKQWNTIGAGITGRPINTSCFIDGFYAKSLTFDIEKKSEEDNSDNLDKQVEGDDKMADEEEAKKEEVEEKKEEETKEEVKEETTEEATEEAPVAEGKSLPKDYSEYKAWKTKQEKEKQTAEFKGMFQDAFKAELKAMNINEPYINPATKFDGPPSSFDNELKGWREAAQSEDMSIDARYEAAARLHQSLTPFGINDRKGGFSSKVAGKSFQVGGKAMQNIQLKGFEYKAQLEHDTNKVSDTDYYQNAAELNDVYDPIIVSHLNDKTTLWGLMKKKNVSNIGSDRYGFRVWRARIEGAGGDTSTYYYDEGATLTGYHAAMLKCQIPFMQYGVTVQVSGLMVAEARGSLGDIFAKQVQRATADLSRGINLDLYGTATGMTAGGAIMGLKLVGDDGGAYGNIYGHDRSTYTTLQGTDDAQTGTPNPDKTLLRKALRTAEKNGADRRNLIFVCDQIQRDKILGLLDPAQRFNATSARAGFEGLPTFDGVPIHADDQCDDGYIYVIPMDSYYAAVLTAPTFEELAKSDDSKKGFIKTYFAVVCENPNWVYKITGLATT